MRAVSTASFIYFFFPYKARNKGKLTPSSAEMADEFPNFFLGIIQVERSIFSISVKLLKKPTEARALKK